MILCYRHFQIGMLNETYTERNLLIENEENKNVHELNVVKCNWKYSKFTQIVKSSIILLTKRLYFKQKNQIKLANASRLNCKMREIQNLWLTFSFEIWRQVEFSSLCLPIFYSFWIKRWKSAFPTFHKLSIEIDLSCFVPFLKVS